MHDNRNEPLLGALRRAEKETLQEVQVGFKLFNNKICFEDLGKKKHIRRVLFLAGTVERLEKQQSSAQRAARFGKYKNFRGDETEEYLLPGLGAGQRDVGRGPAID